MKETLVVSCNHRIAFDFLRSGKKACGEPALCFLLLLANFECEKHGTPYLERSAGHGEQDTICAARTEAAGC